MGINSMILVHHDAIDRIKDDPEFGRKVYEAVCWHWHNKGYERGYVDISVGGFINAATVVAQNHADVAAVIIMGGNTAVELTHDRLYKEDRKHVMDFFIRTLKSGLGWLGIGVSIKKELKEKIESLKGVTRA